MAGLWKLVRTSNEQMKKYEGNVGTLNATPGSYGRFRIINGVEITTSTIESVDRETDWGLIRTRNSWYEFARVGEVTMVTETRNTDWARREIAAILRENRKEDDPYWTCIANTVMNMMLVTQLYEEQAVAVMREFAVTGNLNFRDKMVESRKIAAGVK